MIEKGNGFSKYKDVSVRKSAGSWRPIGPLADLLNYFDAPDHHQRLIARRAGTIAGSRFLPMSKIQTVIEESMESRGLPNWAKVHNRLADMVHDAYRKVRI